MGHLDRDPTRPVYVISVAASIVSAHPRTLRIYEDEGLLCPARTATNIRLYSEEDVRRILWIRHLTQNRGVNLAGVRVLFELEERLGMRILETLFDEANAQDEADRAGAQANGPTERVTAASSSHGSGADLSPGRCSARPMPGNRFGTARPGSPARRGLSLGTVDFMTTSLASTLQAWSGAVDRHPPGRFIGAMHQSPVLRPASPDFRPIRGLRPRLSNRGYDRRWIRPEAERGGRASRRHRLGARVERAGLGRGPRAGTWQVGSPNHVQP